MTVIAPIVELADGVPADDLPGVRLVQQLIDTVTAHPEVREPLLRALLTEDFLVLPERVGRLQEQVGQLQEGFDDFRVETRGEFGRVNARIDEHSRVIAGNTSELEEHRLTLAEHSRVIAGHSQTIAENSRIIAEHSKTIAENTRLLRQLNGHVGRLRGAGYEDHCRDEVAGILDGFLDLAVLADRVRIKSELERARAHRVLTREQYLDGLRPDIIARDIDDDDEAVLLLVGECSITFNRGDVETAYRRARVIEQVMGVKAQPFVVTHYDWPEGIEEVARQFQVAIIRHRADEYAY